MIKKLIATLLLCIPLLAYSGEELVAAVPLHNVNGSACNVMVSDYRPGSNVMYLGKCGWYGLKGPAAYVQTWNFTNHIKVVRGYFDFGKNVNYTKVTYINKVEGIVETYEEDRYLELNRKVYKLYDIMADVKQANVQIEQSMLGYIQFANYMDSIQ
jgi:hypothetical protein